ncbi:hypothetical protein INR49_029088 [Caranx melampygus]|nr:hypothetical protein INR49_029088 [Caranx melampygus]
MDGYAGGSPLNCPLMPAPDTPHHWLCRPASPSADVIPPRTDVEDVKFVINYDYPSSSEDYIHRIGRTARSTNKGTAYTFFTPGNLRQARELIRVLEEARQAINPKLLQLVDTGRGGGGGGGRPRFRGGSNSNNPNLMYQDECDRRMRSVGGGSSKDSRSSSNYSRDSRDSRGGSSRDGDRTSSSSSYRDRSSRDGGRGYSSTSNSYEQYQNNSSSGSQYGSSRATSGSGGGGVGQVPPPSSVPQPLMAQQFNPPQPMMGLMGHSPFQFAPPPPPPPSGRNVSCNRGFIDYLIFSKGTGAEDSMEMITTSTSGRDGGESRAK